VVTWVKGWASEEEEEEEEEGRGEKGGRAHPAGTAAARKLCPRANVPIGMQHAYQNACQTGARAQLEMSSVLHSATARDV